jgi:hypothetical protein
MGHTYQQIKRAIFGTQSHLDPNQPGGAVWHGLTVLNSGSASVTVSTTLAVSGSLFRIATQPNSVGVAANSGGHIVINFDGLRYLVCPRESNGRCRSLE